MQKTSICDLGENKGEHSYGTFGRIFNFLFIISHLIPVNGLCEEELMWVMLYCQVSFNGIVMCCMLKVFVIIQSGFSSVSTALSALQAEVTPQGWQWGMEALQFKRMRCVLLCCFFLIIAAEKSTTCAVYDGHAPRDCVPMLVQLKYVPSWQ